MKKIFILIISFALIIGLSSGVFAADTPAFVIEQKTAGTGDTITVTISLKNNPGIASAKLKVSYDSALDLQKIEYNSELGGMTQQPQRYGSPVTLNWISAFANFSGDAVYATLTFVVSGAAPSGFHPITLTYSTSDVYNIKEEDIYFAVENGGVTVVGPNTETTSSSVLIPVETSPSSTTSTSSTPFVTSPTSTRVTTFTQRTTPTTYTIRTTEPTTSQTSIAEPTQASPTQQTTIPTLPTTFDTSFSFETPYVETTATTVATTAPDPTSNTIVTEPSASDMQSTTPSGTSPSQDGKSIVVPIVIIGVATVAVIAAFVIVLRKKK